ncbi:MAG TPA: hypothetical protein VF995_00810 [Actinomycetota bacterium]
MRMSGVWGRWRRKPPVVAPPRRASDGSGGGNGDGTGTDQGPSGAGAAAAPRGHVAILLDPGLESVASSLQEELGPGFAVVVEPPEPVGSSQSVIAVLDATPDPAASTAVARQRRRHPQAGMLVVASRSAAAATWQTTADLLDAGADDVLIELNTRELAARLKALARRRLATPATPATPAPRMNDPVGHPADDPARSLT